MRRAWVLVIVIAGVIGSPGGLHARPAGGGPSDGRYVQPADGGLHVQRGHGGPHAGPERVEMVGAVDVPSSVGRVAGAGMAMRAATDSESAMYTVFATREGLVGERTANGHTIVERDHFAALPSRRGLSTRDSGERTVRVCAASTGRCAYAPVWDVGPWNTRDDYWNTDREQWTDLPRGKPQAQAAYQDGYNGGKDQFGRVVRNPAGIDLADGTFWDALLLKGNAWVSVTFLWTAQGVTTGQVDTAGSPLRLRAGAGTSAGTTGLAARHAQLPIECQFQGETIAGTVRSTDLWDRVAPGTYVSHAYIAVMAGETIPRCVD